MQDHAETRSEHVGAQERSRWGDVCTIYIYNVIYIYYKYIYMPNVFSVGSINFLLDWVGGAFLQIRLVDSHDFFCGPKDVQRNRRLKWRFSAFLHIPSILLSHPHIFVT